MTDTDQRADAHRKRPKQECDMVMKGGITSGVVYPRAITELMATYRLRSLGGTSAGAIAAAAAAAAELGRASGSVERLEQLPGFLGENLENLIQPNEETTPIYEAMVTLIDHDLDGFGRVLRVTTITTRARPGVFLLAWLVFGIPAWISFASLAGGAGGAAVWAGVLGAALALVLALLVTMVSLARNSLGALTDNGFGACDGLVQSKPGKVPLTEWLTRTFDELAFGACRCEPGADRCRVCDPEGGCLTFADLAADDIDLLMMTTSLSMQRPFRVPFESNEWLWCDQCMAKYFPARVVAQLVRTSADNVDALLTDPTAKGDRRPVERVCPLHPADDPAAGTRKGIVRVLPAENDLPVVIGVRLSLSFPGLFSAVPLLVVDRSRVEHRQQVAVVWMTDGGLSSNFPIHFFDALLPGRPTFGIDLLPTHPDFPDDEVYLPKGVTGASYKRINAITDFVGFGGAIKSTMQNWTDSAQGTLPGYRDRVVQVRMSDDEGGLNLRMSQPQIEKLIKRGHKAAIELRDEFDFERHRETRYRVAQPELDTVLLKMQQTWDGTGGEGYPEFIGARLAAHEALSAEDALAELGSTLSAADRVVVRTMLGRTVNLMMQQARDNALDPAAPGAIGDAAVAATVHELYARGLPEGQRVRLLGPRPRLRMTSRA